MNDENLPDDYQHVTQEQDYYDLFDGPFQNCSNLTCHGEISGDYIFRGIFVLLSRIGFIFVQTGSVPVDNIYTIVVYNIEEIALVLLSYGLIGNWIAFNLKSASGWIAYGSWDFKFFYEYPNLKGTIIGLYGCLLAAGQMSSFFVGRINMASGMLVTVLYCSIFQPLFIHWAWHDNGWMRRNKLFDLRVSLKDHAGDVVIHVPSAIFGTVGALFLGRRILRLEDVDNLSFGTENTVTVVIGYLLILFGYIIFALPTTSPHMITGQSNSTVVVTNSLLALGGGIFVVAILQSMIFGRVSDYRKMVRCVQGGIAALVAVAAAVDIYTPSAVIILSVIAGVFFFFFAEVMHNTPLEDPCSFISSHLVCGFIGIMLCPLLAQKEHLGGSVSLRTCGVHLLWQFICTVTIIGFSTVVALLIFALINISGALRNDSEVINHRRATTMKYSLPKRGFLERLFVINSTTPHVVPGYRKQYFERNHSENTSRNVEETNNAQFSDGDKVRHHPFVELNDVGNNNRNDYTAVAKDKILQNPNTISSIRGAGDYCDPYSQIKRPPECKTPNVFYDSKSEV